MDPELGLQEAADHLGVHYMTVYRYVRQGLLPAFKSGSTWRVSLTDLEAMQAERAARSADPRRGADAKAADWAARFEARAMAGDRTGAWGVVESALGAGTDVGSVYLDLIAPAMASIGRRWADGEVDIAIEHRATTVTTHVMSRLAERFRRAGRTSGTVVLGAAPGDRHGLPVAIVADLARLAGFHVDDLGADVPAASFAVAVASAHRPVAVGISSTTGDNEDAVRAAVTAVRGAVPEVPVMVGGGAVRDDDHARALGADEWAPDAREAVAALVAINGSNGSR